jgi:N-acyl homoserine lactone hydrolase
VILGPQPRESAEHRGYGAPMSISVIPVHVGSLLAGEERLPIRAYLIDHPDGRVLVDAGMTRTHPAVADMDPQLVAPEDWGIDLDAVTAVVVTHLHFDHAGGVHLFAGRPVYVQRAELEDARSLPDYTIPEWIDAPGVDWVPLDGELEVLPGVRVVPAPGHTRGSQIVLVDDGDGPIVIAGDTAVWSGELDEPVTDGQRLIRALAPSAVWLAHADQPWRPAARES